jgi:AraC family transcriptional activator of pobA
MLTDFPIHYLPPVDFLASDQSRTFGAHAPSHRIDFYAIVWFQEDGGTHAIDFEELPVHKDCVFLIGKNQVHSIPSAELPRTKSIVFSAAFFDGIEELFLRQLFLPFHSKGIDIPEAMRQPMHQLFNLIMLEYNTASDSGLLHKYTTILLTHLFRFSRSGLSSIVIGDTRMRKLFQLLEDNYKEQRSAAFYAKQIGLTPKRVNEILRQKMGTTINSLLSRLLLWEAKRQLSHHQFTVKEVTYNLGFSDQSYFARFFRKHTGLSPEEFKLC